MSNKKFIVIGIIIAVVCFALGFIVAQMNKTGVSLGENTFQAGWDAAKQRLAESGFAPAIAGMEIKTISGEGKEIKGNKINLKIRPLEPLADPKLDNRVVVVDDNTKIFKLESRDPVEYQKEMDVYNRKIQQQTANPAVGAQPLVFPDFFIKKEKFQLNMENYHGIIVNVSQKDKSIFDRLKILGEKKLWSWILYKVEIKPKELKKRIKELQENMTEGFYFHFYRNNELIAKVVVEKVFKDYSSVVPSEGFTDVRLKISDKVSLLT